MGRHKKVVEEIPVPSEVVEEPIAVKAIELNSVALGIAKDSTGRWFIVKVPFNLIEKVAGVPEASGQGDDRMVAVERFKIEAANSVLKND